jgi:Fanconi anemia group J protein
MRAAICCCLHCCVSNAASNHPPTDSPPTPPTHTQPQVHGALAKAAAFNGRPEIYAPLRDAAGALLKWLEAKEGEAVAAMARGGQAGRPGYAGGQSRFEPYERVWQAGQMMGELSSLGLGPEAVEPLWEAYQAAREEDEAMAQDAGRPGGGGGDGVPDGQGGADGAGGGAGGGAAARPATAARVGAQALGTVSRLVQVARMLHELSAPGGRDFRLALQRVHASHALAGGAGGGASGGRGRSGRARVSLDSGADDGPLSPDFVVTFCLWCMSPAVAFRQIAGATRSVILTSGTLSPLESFASELGVPFAVRLEAPHVVDMARQVWAGAVGAAPNGKELVATYAHTEKPEFQDGLGEAVAACCGVIPDGVLLFFPSYAMLDKMSARWRASGAWAHISATKTIVAEPRGGGAEALDAALKEYYGAVASGRGALLLAVCRGKVSEGLDFADANARGVLVVGVPFPSVRDVKVAQKKAFNDAGRAAGLLPGSQWYEQQAFRALNQAVGRCIRHRADWGAIVLLDARFREPRFQRGLSRWLRGALTAPRSFGEAAASMGAFFARLAADPPAAPACPPPPPGGEPVEDGREEEEAPERKVNAIAMLMAGARGGGPRRRPGAGAGGGGGAPPPRPRDIQPWMATEAAQPAQAPAEPTGVVAPEVKLEGGGAAGAAAAAYVPAPPPALPPRSPSPWPPASPRSGAALAYALTAAPMAAWAAADLAEWTGWVLAQGAAGGAPEARALALGGLLDAFAVVREALGGGEPPAAALARASLPPPRPLQALVAAGGGAPLPQAGLDAGAAAFGAASLRGVAPPPLLLDALDDAYRAALTAAAAAAAAADVALAGAPATAAKREAAGGPSGGGAEGDGKRRAVVGSRRAEEAAAARAAGAAAAAAGGGAAAARAEAAAAAFATDSDSDFH